MKIRIPLLTLSALIVTMACGTLTPLPDAPNVRPCHSDYCRFQVEMPVRVVEVSALRLAEPHARKWLVEP